MNVQILETVSVQYRVRLLWLIVLLTFKNYVNYYAKIYFDLFIYQKNEQIQFLKVIKGRDITIKH